MAGSATVTVLFTDLVGSTVLQSALGDIAYDSVRRAHFASLREAIAGHGGDEVKNVGDGLMVTFASTADAVRCAGAMQQATVRLARRRPEADLAIRVGVSVGEATSEDGDWFGTPVVEAARLCAAAESGQVLVTDIVRALVGTRDAVVFERVGELSLKGLPAPITAHAVAWSPPASDHLLPAALVAGERGFFAGREHERDLLQRRWKDATTGHRQVVLVGGEPGVGKTRLVSELALDAHDEGAVVLFGRCDEELLLPYQPFVEAFTHLVATIDDEVLRAHVAASRGELARLVPELARRVPDLPLPAQADGEAERALFFAAAVDLLTRATDEAPVVLILDDLHWAAKPTLLLLRQLLRATEYRMLLIAATYRDTELDRAHPLAGMLADLRREAGVERVSLSGLDADAVFALVEAAAGEATGLAGRALADAVTRHTEGNPFFVTEVLRHLVESGAVYRRDDRWVYDRPVEQLGIPEGVKEVVGRRLSRLSDEANAVLAAAAIVGPEFDLDIVETIHGADPLDALDAAVQANVIDEVSGAIGRYRFAHALVRQTLESELSSARRVRLHRAVMDAIEQRHGDDLDAHLPALALHACEAARAGDVRKAAEYSLRAAEQALDRLAFEDAIAIADRGLEVLQLDDNVDRLLRAQLNLVSADSMSYLGDGPGTYARADRALEDARAVGADVVFALAAQVRTRYPVVGQPDDVAIAACQEGLRRLGDGNPRLRSQLLSALAWQAHADDREARVRLAHEAKVLADESGDFLTRAENSLALRQAWYGSANLDEFETMTSEALRDARQASNPWWELQALNGVILLHLARGDHTSTKATMELAQQLTDALHSTWFDATLSYLRAMLATIAGDWEQAEQHAADSLGDNSSVNALNTYAAQVLALRYEQGRLDEIVPMIEATAAQMQSIPAFTVALAVSYIEVGRPDEARPLHATLAADGYRALREDMNWGVQLAWCAELCGQLDDTAAAAVLLPKLQPFSGQMILTAGAITIPGAADRFLGILYSVFGQPEHADRAFAVAVKLETAMDAPVLATRTRYWWARARGDRDGAAAAAAEADRLGMTALAKQARDLHARLTPP